MEWSARSWSELAGFFLSWNYLDPRVCMRMASLFDGSLQMLSASACVLVGVTVAVMKHQAPNQVGEKKFFWLILLYR